jgi:hypothetical protein
LIDAKTQLADLKQDENLKKNKVLQKAKAKKQFKPNDGFGSSIGVVKVISSSETVIFKIPSWTCHSLSLTFLISVSWLILNKMKILRKIKYCKKLKQRNNLNPTMK